MQLSVEILDHVFSYLVSHRETLIACSKDPVLFPIVERHLYYHVIVNIGPVPADREPDYAFEPKRLSELVSKRPHIKHYVRILQIQVNEFEQLDLDGTWTYFLDEAAKHLLRFPNLECIMLTISEHTVHDWPLSPAFRSALKELSLPVKEIRITGSQNFPISTFYNCKNIKHLTLSGIFEDGLVGDSAFPLLKSLALDAYLSSSTRTWVKLHINELQSLKCASSSTQMLPELLGVCSETLKGLEIDFRNSPYSSIDPFPTEGLILINHFPELSHIPKILQQLTIRTAVQVEDMAYGSAKRFISSLPVAAEVINALISSPRLEHLILDIDIGFFTLSQFDQIDFTPLAVLGPASLSIPRIELYVHTAGNFPSALTRAQLLVFLMEYKDIVRSIKEGILVIHSEKTAPNAWL